MPALLSGISFALAALVGALRGARAYDAGFLLEGANAELFAFAAYFAVPTMGAVALSVGCLMHWRSVRAAFVPEFHDGPTIRKSLRAFWVVFVLALASSLATDLLAAFAWG